MTTALGPDLPLCLSIWALEPSLVVGFRSADLLAGLCFGQLHTRQAISAGACDCCAPICSVLLEDLKNEVLRGASLANVLYGFCGCHTNSLLHHLQLGPLYFYEGSYLHRFWEACGDPVPKQYAVICNRALELLFCCPLLAFVFCFRIICLFRCRITGFWCPALCWLFGKGVLKSCCWQRFQW